MKKHAFCILLVLCLVPAALFGTPLQASGEEPPVVFADFSWDSVQFHNRVAGFILEHGFGKEDISLSHGEAAAAFLKKHRTFGGNGWTGGGGKGRRSARGFGEVMAVSAGKGGPGLPRRPSTICPERKSAYRMGGAPSYGKRTGPVKGGGRRVRPLLRSGSSGGTRQDPERRGDHILGRLVPYWEGWYLASRAPLPVHSNPFYLFASDTLPGESCPFRLAARLALSAAAFCTEIDRGTLEPDTFRGAPLCMKEYERLFRTSRRALPGADVQATGTKTGPAGRSALVLSGGVPFLLELYSEEDGLRDVEETARHLREMASFPPDETPPVGLITTLHRDEAALGRRLLLEGGKDNERLLSLAEESLFVLRLDGPCGSSPEERARHFLFDGGQNGWYEKSFQLIVTADGQAGINFEPRLQGRAPRGAPREGDPFPCPFRDGQSVGASGTGKAGLRPLRGVQGFP